MPRYIDADALQRRLQRDADLYKGCNDADMKARRDEALNAVACVVNAPTADVAPVVHARWVKLGEADYQCSSCGFRFTSGDDISEFKHCRCGAKMDGERS